MAKEFDFEGLDSVTEGVNLRAANNLIDDLEAMRAKNIPIDKLTMKELQGKIKELMDLQTAFGSASPKEIGVALTKLRNIQNQELEEIA